jgi:hypothetical protein
VNRAQRTSKAFTDLARERDAAIVEAAKAQKKVRKLQRERRTLLCTISQMLWVQPTYNGNPSCSYCGNQKHLHNDPCFASALLKETGFDTE